MNPFTRFLFSQAKWSKMIETWRHGAMLGELQLCCYTEEPPPPSHPSVENLLVRGWGVFSLQGHIPLNRLPSFSSLSSILSLLLYSPSLFPSWFPRPSSSTPHIWLSPALQPPFNFCHRLLLSVLQQRQILPSRSYRFSPLYPSASLPLPVKWLLCSRA